MSEHKHNPPDPFAMVNAIKTQGPAPVHLWDPPFCGDIDLCIKRDGSWVHEGRPIRRMAMVRLFASILKREGEEFFLVTPVEKVRIQVEDCPFLVVTMAVRNEGAANAPQVIEFTTNVGDSLTLDSTHPLRLGTEEAAPEAEPHPTVRVRNGLDALLRRSVFYQLVELAQPHPEDAARVGVWSSGVFFALT